MDDYFSRKIAEGEAKGRAEGLMKASKAIYQKLLEMGFNPEIASQATSVTQLQ